MRYDKLRRLPTADRARAVANLKVLRDQLDREIPPKDATDNLLLASWNVRDLAKTNRRGFGKRLPESLFYIAEVLSRFDFVAVQEVNELDEWQRITDILGYEWDWIATDVTDTALGGNGERLTYLYDRRKVSFQNIAGELVLPAKLLITTNVETDDPQSARTGESTTTLASGEEVGKQFRRTPFTAQFQCAWFKFDICTVHIYYGSESGAKLKERVQEIKRVAEFFGKRAERSLADGRSLILLGDFNVVGHDHETMKALLASGFTSPKALRELPTNIGQDKYYDQIVFRTRPGDIDYLETSEPGGAPPRAGAFSIFDHVFTPEQFEDYRAAAAETSNGGGLGDAELRDYYLDWRTYQFSDHLPLWVRLKVNDSADYLDELVT